MCLRVPLALVALLGFAPLAHARDNVAELRKAAKESIDLLRRNAPSDRMLQSFAPEAFENSITRLIVTFTDGSASDSPKQIRIYVADALKQISEAASEEGRSVLTGDWAAS
jgi:hypothetical protein